MGIHSINSLWLSETMNAQLFWDTSDILLDMGDFLYKSILKSSIPAPHQTFVDSRINQMTMLEIVSQHLVTPYNTYKSWSTLILAMPWWHQAISWTRTNFLSIGPQGAKFNGISITTLQISLKKMELKMLSVKCQPFCSSVMSLLLTSPVLCVSNVHHIGSGGACLLCWCRPYFILFHAWYH